MFLLTLNNLSQFLVVMLATLVVCSTILYCAASINVAKVYLHIMKEYGWPFGNTQCHSLLEYRFR